MSDSKRVLVTGATGHMAPTIGDRIFTDRKLRLFGFG
jgi:hypothetical protein